METLPYLPAGGCEITRNKIRLIRSGTASILSILPRTPGKKSRDNQPGIFSGSSVGATCRVEGGGRLSVDYK